MIPWPAFLTFAFVASYTPGPNNILSMRHAARYGFRKSCLFNLGILAGVVVVMALCTLFSAALYSVIPTIKPLMLIVGAAYMLWLAWKTLRSTSGDEARQEREMRGGSLFWQGAALQFVNPKYLLYCITSMASYVLPFSKSPPAVAGCAAILVAVGISATFVWALFGAAFQRALARHERAFNIGMAILLVYCAVSLFL